MSNESVADTTISEPSITADEAQTLLFALDRCRATFAWKCGGLDAAALHRAHPPSAMTIASLVKHMAIIEDKTTFVDLQGRAPGPPWDTVDWDADPRWDWHSAADDSPQDLYALWRGAVERARHAWRRAVADGGLDQPSRILTDSGEPPNLRRVLVDLHEEYARHVGHADLFREAIDGLVGEDPPQQ